MKSHNIGKLIREKRKDKRMSQGDLAKKLGVSIPCVSDWERGVNTPIIENLVKIERILDIGVLTQEFTSEGEYHE